MNRILITSLFAILFAQVIKLPIAYSMNRDAAKISIVTSTGGMPSSHSAAVSSLIAYLIFDYGFGSPHVAIATIFGVIVMFDSMGVRRQSGEQGIVIDTLLRHYRETTSDDGGFQINSMDEDINPNLLNKELEDYNRMIVKKYLGHKPSEVIAGMITGVLVATFFKFVIFR